MKSKVKGISILIALIAVIACIILGKDDFNWEVFLDKVNHKLEGK